MPNYSIRFQSPEFDSKQRHNAPLLPFCLAMPDKSMLAVHELPYLPNGQPKPFANGPPLLATAPAAATIPTPRNERRGCLGLFRGHRELGPDPFCQDPGLKNQSVRLRKKSEKVASLQIYNIGQVRPFR